MLNIIDTTNWQEFRLEEIFTVDKGDVDLQQKDIDNKGYAFINSGIENRGIKGYTSREAKIFPANTLTIDMFGNVYYRDFEYKLATHNHVISLNSDLIKGKEEGMFLESVLFFLKEMFSYNNMCTWNKIKDIKIKLPVVEKDIPNYEYMEKYIAHLEVQRLQELEAYLSITGLDDYNLTEEDMKVLDKFKEIEYEIEKV